MTIIFIDPGLYPRPTNAFVQYGTAGFRSRAEELDYVLFRMGILSVLRSKAKGGATIGVMITASHNPEPDNGVKLVDPMGEMLDQSWELLATEFANASTDSLQNILEKIVAVQGIDMTIPASVFVGQDTRPSSPTLAQAVLTGIKLLGAEVKDYGVITTPMLHYFVTCKNTDGEYGEATERGYYCKLTTAFKRLRGESMEKGNYSPSVLFDGANGVGALKMKGFLPHLENSLNVEVFNDGRGKLNHLCGADYVKVNQCAPEGLPFSINTRCVSVDGDADRIMYFYTDEAQKFHLMDGDRIGTLVAGYLMELVKQSGLDLQLGLVQTAYANGSSTNYIARTLKVPVACVNTGVKFLHHRAIEFDIGVYFEANGHGTVVFKKSATYLINKAASDLSLSDIQRAASTKLSTVMDVINQTVGDAISDMLLVETILHARGWSIKDWEAAYTDLPNRLQKVAIKDRRMIQTTDAERKCVSPQGLQDAIDVLVAKFCNGRAFVRASGTEDVVRVYAEADTQTHADELAAAVAKAVSEITDSLG